MGKKVSEVGWEEAESIAKTAEVPPNWLRGAQDEATRIGESGQSEF